MANYSPPERSTNNEADPQTIQHHRHGGSPSPLRRSVVGTYGDVEHRGSTAGSARRITANIQRTEQRIAGEEAAAFRIIDEAINKLPDGTLQAQLDTLNGFRQATAVLHGMAGLARSS